MSSLEGRGREEESVDNTAAALALLAGVSLCKRLPEEGRVPT